MESLNWIQTWIVGCRCWSCALTSIWCEKPWSWRWRRNSLPNYSSSTAHPKHSSNGLNTKWTSTQPIKFMHLYLWNWDVFFMHDIVKNQSSEIDMQAWSIKCMQMGEMAHYGWMVSEWGWFSWSRPWHQSFICLLNFYHPWLLKWKLAPPQTDSLALFGHLKNLHFRHGLWTQSPAIMLHLRGNCWGGGVHNW